MRLTVALGGAGKPTTAAAREIARIKALPSPALPLDVQVRFDALKARTPKLGGGGNVPKREPAQDLPKDLQSRFDALKANMPKPGGAGSELTRQPADDSPEGLQIRFDALKASIPKPASGRNSLVRQPEAANVDKVDSGVSQPASIDVDVSVSVHAEANSTQRAGTASQAESAKPIESPVPNEAHAGHAEEGVKTEGTNVEGAAAEETKTEGAKTEGAGIEEAKTDPQDPHEELAGLAGKVNDHVNGMHHAVSAHPSEQEQLMMQEMAALHELAMLISQILARLTQRSGEALLAITRS
ncbi:hypothetical protein EPN42_16055 [bacterium]|nr:MAG: hypothetical protein EPN42_16055 [bacterium]